MPMSTKQERVVGPGGFRQAFAPALQASHKTQDSLLNMCPETNLGMPKRLVPPRGLSALADTDLPFTWDPKGAKSWKEKHEPMEV